MRQLIGYWPFLDPFETILTTAVGVQNVGLILLSSIFQRNRKVLFVSCLPLSYIPLDYQSSKRPSCVCQKKSDSEMTNGTRPRSKLPTADSTGGASADSCISITSISLRLSSVKVLIDQLLEKSQTKFDDSFWSQKKGESSLDLNSFRRCVDCFHNAQKLVSSKA